MGPRPKLRKLATTLARHVEHPVGVLPACSVARVAPADLAMVARAPAAALHATCHGRRPKPRRSAADLARGRSARTWDVMTDGAHDFPCVGAGQSLEKADAALSVRWPTLEKTWWLAGSERLGRGLAMRHISCALGVLALLLAGGGAQANDSNFRPYIVGGRAAGMGGAVTALADDGSGPYYNPGGLAFAEHSMLSLSASVYGIVRGFKKDGLGKGHDFNSSNLNVFPVSTSAITKFGVVDKFGSARNAVALSVFVPDAMLINGEDTLGSEENTYWTSEQEQTVWSGATYGHRFNRFGIGAAVFVLAETKMSLLDFRTGTESDFKTLTARSEQTIVGVVA